MNLSTSKATEMCTEMFGDKFTQPLADTIGLSSARLYQIFKMKTVPVKTAKKIVEAFQEFKANGGVAVAANDPNAALSDVEIRDRIRKRFHTMNRMATGMVEGKIRSLIISGAPGIGKTYDLEKLLKAAERNGTLKQHEIIKGTISGPGLFQALHRNRFENSVLVLDDTDAVFGDEDTLNILKTALDTSDERHITWSKNSKWISEDDGEEAVGDTYPRTFEFKGGVIFITNKNFEAELQKDTKLAPHFNALMSRSMFLNLTLHSVRDKLIRIEDIFMNNMVKMHGLTQTEGQEVLQFVKTNANRFHELSLRLMLHITQLRAMGDDWKQLVEDTKMKVVF